MCLELVISDNRSDFFLIWNDVFAEIQGVSIFEIHVRDLHRLPNLDAVIMRGIFAHERYGGSPKIGESQILTTQGELEMTSWVVTTPPFTGHLEKRKQIDSSIKYQIVRDKKLSFPKEDYLVFSKVFDRIKRFNSQNPNSQIRTIGFDGGFMGFPRGDIRQEAEAVRDAYLNI